MKNTYNLSKTKIVLHRKRINQLYHKSIDYDVISIVTGSGYGKTQSVMSFVSELDAHIVWISFSPLDNYTVHFWEKFCNASHTISDDFSSYCLKAGYPNDTRSMYHFLEQLKMNIRTDKPLLFIFDDCHLIEEKSISIFIHNLIKAALDNTTIFLISRTINYLNAESILGGHSVKFIDENILTFTASETTEYFQLMDISLPSNLLLSIYKKTEGWPIAICLLGLYGRENPSAITASPQLTSDILLTMIDNKIFSHCSPDDQKLLLKLSLLDFLPARYVEEVYGKDSLSRIRSNLLIRYNAHSNSYSLHQLLRDFLKQHIHLLAENEIQNTYQIAAAWFTKYNLVIDALHCYEYLQDAENLWRIIWDTLTSPNYPSRELLAYFQKILDYLSQHASFHSPWLPSARAVYYTLMAEFSLAEEKFHQIIEDNSVSDITPVTESIIGEAQLNIALIRMLHGDISFRHYFQQARKHLPQGSVTLNKGRMIVLNGDTITLKNGTAGELDAWIQAQREIVQDADALLHGAMHGMADLVTAQAYYYRGNMSRAEQFALTTLYNAKEEQCVDIVGSAYYLLQKIFMYRGDYQNTQRYIKTSYEYMEEYNKNPGYNLPEIAEGFFLTQIEEGEEMKDWILNDSLYHKSLLSSNYGLEKLLKGHYLLKKQHYSELFAYLEYTKKIYEQSHRFTALIYTHLLYCFAYQKTGNLEEAVQSFETAYNMSAPNGIIMPFIEMGHYTRTVCRLIHAESTQIPAEWLDMIQTKSSTYRKRIQLLRNEYIKKHANHTTSITLTAREKNILFLTCQGLTRNELAEEMHISVNTVKSIQKSIYTKLGAYNISHAIYIAAKNNLLD